MAAWRLADAREPGRPRGDKKSGAPHGAPEGIRETPKELLGGSRLRRGRRGLRRLLRLLGVVLGVLLGRRRRRRGRSRARRGRGRGRRGRRRRLRRGSGLLRGNRHREAEREREAGELLHDPNLLVHDAHLHRLIPGRRYAPVDEPKMNGAGGGRAAKMSATSRPRSRGGFMRRRLVATRSASLVLSLAGVVAASAQTASGPTSPPVADKRPVTDTYHGVSVRDDYRWLEDATASEVKTWSDGQNGWARSVLDRLPSVPALRARLRQIASAPSPSWSSLARRGDVLFALKSDPPKQQPFLVQMATSADPATERILVDPNALDASGGTAIDWYVPSVDGKLVAVSLSKGGSEAGDVHVFDAATGK